MRKPKPAIMDETKTPALPSESDLELESDYLQPSHSDDQTSAQEFLESGPALDYKAIQNALLQALSANGWADWYAACPQIYTECNEPHRTIVFDKASLRLTQIWLDSLAGSTPSPEAALCLPAQLHSPLSDAPPKPITINF